MKDRPDFEKYMRDYKKYPMEPDLISVFNNCANRAFDEWLSGIKFSPEDFPIETLHADDKDLIKGYVTECANGKIRGYNDGPTGF